MFSGYFWTMRIYVFFLVMLSLVYGCEKNCNEDLLVGEILQIPLDLSSFSDAEKAGIFVWNVNVMDTVQSQLESILWRRSFSEDNNITDNSPDGYYSSDLDGSSLIFYALLSDTSYQLLDSMTDITVKKSKGDVDDVCYEDDPNVQIDELSYIHDGKTKGKDDVVVLRK